MYEASCITFQTAHMRSRFGYFPEVMLVDATHMINNLGYQLFSFTIHDAFGMGQYAQMIYVAVLA